MSTESTNSQSPSPQSRPDNLTFIAIPHCEVPRETDELSFLLRPSAISGVGVFLTHPVKKGTYLALFWDDTVRRIPYAEMAWCPKSRRADSGMHSRGCAGRKS